MTPEASRHLERADELAAKTRRLDANEVPEAVIHLAYFAMFHAAVGALLARQGKAPRKHGQVIGTFGRLVKDMGEAERALGRGLNRAYDVRCAIDYDIGAGDVTRDAITIRDEAAVFVTACRRLATTRENFA